MFIKIALKSLDPSGLPLIRYENGIRNVQVFPDKLSFQSFDRHISDFRVYRYDFSEILYFFVDQEVSDVSSPSCCDP